MTELEQLIMEIRSSITGTEELIINVDGPTPQMRINVPMHEISKINAFDNAVDNLYRPEFIDYGDSSVYFKHETTIIEDSNVKKVLYLLYDSEGELVSDFNTEFQQVSKLFTGYIARLIFDKPPYIKDNVVISYLVKYNDINVSLESHITSNEGDIERHNRFIFQSLMFDYPTEDIGLNNAIKHLYEKQYDLPF